MRIVLDPGHVAGYNQGYYDPYQEGTAMWEYAFLLAEKLTAHGMEVEVTRKALNENPTLTARGKMAAGADMFVSLHSNAASVPEGHGVSVFYSIKRPGDKDVAETFSRELAGLIGGGTRDRGGRTRKSTKGDWDYYTVIQKAAETDCPHILLVEHGFHTNPVECLWLMDDSHMDAMAELEADLILRTLGADKLEQGWVRGADRRWRYYSPDGQMLYSQWLLYNGAWYRLMEDGTMAEGWARIGGKWFYLNPVTGAMVTGEHVIDGKSYVFDDQGVMV